MKRQMMNLENNNSMEKQENIDEKLEARKSSRIIKILDEENSENNELLSDESIYRK